MNIRIQPEPVVVTDADPFRNDRLDRKETAEVLTHLLGSVHGPCVLALDATWGMGKTTFLQMWKQQLRNDGFHVVMFNAWETDFANDPFLALSEELHAELEQHLADDHDALTRLKDAARKILEKAWPALIGTLFTQAIGSVGGEIAAGALRALGDESQSQYGEAKTAIKKFREALGTATHALAKPPGAATPLVVIIDELDRCRPSYAVELLEVLKHLYSVDGVVFVLAMNRDELAHSVQALYGAKFRAALYLRRFIDIDVRLPDADRTAFIDAQVEALQSQVEGVHGRSTARRVDGVARDWLHRFFGTPDVDLRTLQQALHRLGLVMAILRGDHDALVKTATFVLILRTMEPELYTQFLDGRATDEDVAEGLFGRVPGGYRATNEGRNLETEIIMAALEDDHVHDRSFEETSSRLFGRYHELASKETGGNALRPDVKHAVAIVKCVSSERSERAMGWGDNRFRDTVARLEILSRELQHPSS